MRPTIAIGDQIVVDKRAYDVRLPFVMASVAQHDQPARGDIVTFPSPLDGVLYVKRIVGVPGDVVSMRRNELTVNGQAADYEIVGEDGPFLILTERLLGSERTIQWMKTSRRGAAKTFGPIVLPEGEYLMLGDNRDQSFDSRRIGTVSRENILGQARMVAFSLNYDRGFAPREERYLSPLR